MIVKKVLLGLLVLGLTCSMVSAQNIFTYGGTPVSSAEFLRMYTKNTFNNKKPDMSEKALREYVTLYSRFKMKVAEAEKNGIDTLSNIKSELNNYKKQLAKSYLNDKDMVTKLTAEAYERSKKEINAAHIMVSIPKGSERDSAKYFAKADSLYKVAIAKKTPWDSLVKFASDDKSTIPNGGSVGYFTALQIPYNFETVAYALKVGEIGKPVRTQYGYHIIKKIAERPARGQVKVQHILCVAKKSMGEEGLKIAKAKADSVLAEIKKGTSFDSLAKNSSEDRFSNNNFGELQAFGCGTMAKPFEDAAFALVKPGDISPAVLTEYGYHIIRLKEKLPLKPLEESKNDLTKKVERDLRIDIAKRAFLDKIKAKNGVKEDAAMLDKFIASIADSLAKNGIVQTGGAMKSDDALLTIGSKKITVNNFNAHLDISARNRLYGTKQDAVRLAYNNFVEKEVLEYEEGMLEQNNPEFKSLLKEYRDGIILFDLTDKSVWSKATADSAGLEKFFATNGKKYQWGPGFEGTQVKCSDMAGASKFIAAFKGGADIDSASRLVNTVENSTAQVETGRFEYEKLDASLKAIMENKVSTPIKNSDNSYSVYVPKTIALGNTAKTLNEARGYVIADYQDFLEKEWLASLERKYPVVVNDVVFKGLVGKK
jgi:peptidyl-prolyl cis-trans isomerase SurA